MDFFSAGAERKGRKRLIEDREKQCPGLFFWRLARRESAEGAGTRDGFLMEDEAAAGMEGDLGAGFFVEGEGGEGWITGL